jgi:SAM-dependent methyltransferase
VSATDAVFDAMRQSEMRAWVGDAEPRAIGEQNFRSIVENFPLRRDHTVFDFGCGIGRTSVPLAEFLTEGRLIGADMVAKQIQFCHLEIASRFPNTAFRCTRAHNPHYDPYAAADRDTAIDEAAFFAAHHGMFDLTVAFSVFTHFDPTMAARYLRALRDMTKPGGQLLLTWFLDHPDNPADRRLSGGEFADPTGELGFAVFSLPLVQHLASTAGLSVLRVTYGFWRGWAWDTVRGQHPQDMIILARLNELPADFDPQRYLALNADVASTGVDPAMHYFAFGRNEGRRLK